MRVHLFALAAVAASSLALFACGSDTTEGCTTGECTSSSGETSGGGSGTTATGTGGAGTTGTGGAGPGGEGPDCGNGGSGGTPDEGDIPCEVFQVIKDKCQSCHGPTPSGGAPFSIMTWEDTQQPFGNITRWERMEQVIQPGSSPHMPFYGAPQLTDDEFTTLDTWLKCGAKPIAQGTGCE